MLDPVATSPLLILPASRVADVLASTAVGYVISIGAPGEAIPDGVRPGPTVLRLEFADLVYDDPRGPQLDDVTRLVKFARTIQADKGTLLVHCAAGISRSTAAAVVVIAHQLGPGHERLAIDGMLRAQPDAWPNRRVVELADGVLGRGGALLAELDKTWAPHLRV